MSATVDDSMSTQTPTRAKAAWSGWLRRLDHGLVVAGGVLAVATMVVIGLTLLVSVVLRYVSGSSLPFATELPTYLFPWLVCGGIVAAAGAGGHLAVDFVVTRLPRPAARVVPGVMWLLVTVTLVGTAVSALGLTATFEGQTTATLGWPTLGSYLAFPISLVLLAMHAAGRTIAAILALPDSPGGPAGHVTEPLS